MSTQERTTERDDQNIPQIRRLWLVRHGATIWNSRQRFCGHSDIALSRQGQAQARWLAHRLSTERIVAIYTSDLQRACQTAEIIADRCRSEVTMQVSPAWRELAFGAWEGLTYTQITKQYPHQLAFFTDPLHAAPPHGESVDDLLQRIQGAFRDIIHTCAISEGDIVLVSHGGPLRVLLCILLGIAPERQWQFRLDPGSLSALDLSLTLPLPFNCWPAATLTLFNVQRPVRQRTRTPALTASLSTPL